MIFLIYTRARARSRRTKRMPRAPRGRPWTPSGRARRGRPRACRLNFPPETDARGDASSRARGRGTTTARSTRCEGGRCWRGRCVERWEREGRGEGRMGRGGSRRTRARRRGTWPRARRGPSPPYPMLIALRAPCGGASAGGETQAGEREPMHVRESMMCEFCIRT